MEKEIVLYYDKECPICKEYSKYVKLREKYTITLCNAREYPNRIEQFKKVGFDINDGIILIYKDSIFQGDKAIVIIDSLTCNKTYFDKVLGVFIKIPYMIKIIYPLLKLIRLLLLKVLGVSSKIEISK